ncbi:MAG: sugar phosphate isomerase/epimerase family protein, partial [Limisphaerales bacterium]
MNRRHFLNAAALGAAALATNPIQAAAPKVKLGISSYSYWHFRAPKVPIEKVIENASALNVPGVDILHRQMDSEDSGYLQKLKRTALINGVDLICLSIHQDFVDPKPEYRQRQIDHTIKCINLAHEMGIPCIRLNSGRWGTIRSFDGLMKARGLEPVLPGYKEDDGFKWCIDSIEKCLPAAERRGVVLALENHWGLTRTPEGLLRVANA